MLKIATIISFKIQFSLQSIAIALETKIEIEISLLGEDDISCQNPKNRKCVRNCLKYILLYKIFCAKHCYWFRDHCRKINLFMKKRRHLMQNALKVKCGKNCHKYFVFYQNFCAEL